MKLTLPTCKHGGSWALFIVRTCSILMVMAFLGNGLRAQGIERESLAGESAAQATHTSSGDQPYNLSLGPVTLRAEAGVSTSYNDNINLASTGRLNDFIVTPQLTINAFWQVTDMNDLSLDVGMGYQRYLMHPNYSSQSPLFSPTSQLQFNVYVGDFKFNFHDHFSFQEDPIQQGDLSNVTSSFGEFNNSAGVQIDWDLSDVILTLSYDHSNIWVFQSQYDYLDSDSNIISPKVTFQVSKTISTGIEAVFTQTEFAQNIQNGSNGVTVGPFVNANVSENLSVNAQVGWDYQKFSTGGLNGDTESVNSYYWSVGANQRVNDFVTQSLTVGREFVPGLTTNFTQTTYANYTPTWKVTPSLSLAPNLWWQNLDDSGGTFRQTANRYGAGIGLAYQITQHLSGGVNYQYTLKKADPNYLNYEQDVITLNLNYQF